MRGYIASKTCEFLRLCSVFLSSPYSKIEENLKISILMNLCSKNEAGGYERLGSLELA